MTVLSVSVFGPESVSYERSRLENRTNLHHFSARGFFVQLYKYPKVSISVFPSSQVIKMDRFPVFPSSQAIKTDHFPIFPGSQASNPAQNQLKDNTRHSNRKYDDKENHGVSMLFFTLVAPVVY